jgi:hypothetical protein
MPGRSTFATAPVAHLLALTVSNRIASCPDSIAGVPDSRSGWWPRRDPWRAAMKATITVVVSGCGSRDDASVGTDGGREALGYEHVIAA